MESPITKKPPGRILFLQKMQSGRENISHKMRSAPTYQVRRDYYEKIYLYV